MTFHIVDDETMQLIRRALQSGSRHNIRVCKTALLKINGESVLDMVNTRMESLSQSESDAYVYSDELNRLQFIRSSIESGGECVEEFLLIQKHITPGHYCMGTVRQMRQLLEAGFTEFMLPNDELLKQVELKKFADITVKQLRAARALIGWRRAELARKARVPVDVIVNLELNGIEPTLEQRRAIVEAMQAKGIQFKKDGVEQVDLDPQSLAYDLANAPFYGVKESE